MAKMIENLCSNRFNHHIIGQVWQRQEELFSVDIDWKFGYWMGCHTHNHSPISRYIEGIESVSKCRARICCLTFNSNDKFDRWFWTEKIISQIQMTHIHYTCCFCCFMGGSMKPLLSFVLPDIFFEVNFEAALCFLPRLRRSSKTKLIHC